MQALRERFVEQDYVDVDVDVDRAVRFHPSVIHGDQVRDLEQDGRHAQLLGDRFVGEEILQWPVHPLMQVQGQLGAVQPVPRHELVAFHET